MQERIIRGLVEGYGVGLVSELTSLMHSIEICRRNFEGLDARIENVWSEMPWAVDVRGSVFVRALPAVKEQRQPFAMGES